MKYCNRAISNGIINKFYKVLRKAAYKIKAVSKPQLFPRREEKSTLKSGKLDFIVFLSGASRIW
jgi:hypothetical protein